MGQTSLFTLAPDRDFAILLVTNSGAGGQLNPKVTNWALGEYAGVTTPELAHLETPETSLEEYAGEYEATLSAVSVTVDEEGLSISRRSLGGFPTRDAPPASTEPSPPVRFALYDEDHIVGLEEPFKGALAQFLRNPDGSIEWLRIGMRVHRPL